jgi:hypothetical protein
LWALAAVAEISLIRFPSSGRSCFMMSSLETFFSSPNSKHSVNPVWEEDQGAAQRICR